MHKDWLYEILAKPLLFRIDAEDAHYAVQNFVRKTAGIWANSGWFDCETPELQTDFLGTILKNPIGLAAGFDKNGYLVEVLGHLGFGFAEIGSVTARPSSGNPKPRLFRLPADRALINRLGLNGDGADAVAARLRSSAFSLPIGINIAKTNVAPRTMGDTMVEDMMHSFRAVKDLPVLFVTLNASCPNTHEGIMRETEELETLFAQIRAENTRSLPVLVKLSPDSSDELIEKIVFAAKTQGLSGFVCGNTTTSRVNLHTRASKLADFGAGGLSGPPLKQLCLALVRKVAGLKSPEQVIIGVGGVETGQDARDYLSAGATAVELYTSLVYRGPLTVKYIAQELQALL
jgi:dihydroorotate dehydrogenase